MVWAVDKRIVRYPLEDGGQFAEVPVRTRFEYELEAGVVRAESLQIETLYNKREVLRHFGNVTESWLDAEIDRTARQAIYESLRHAGYRVEFDDSDGAPSESSAD